MEMADFTGGMNTKAGPGAMLENEYGEAQNVYLWERGIAKRKGYDRYNGSARISTTNKGVGLCDAPFVAGNQIVGVAGSVIAKKETNTWTDITDVVSLTSNTPVLFTMINDNLVGVNGVDPAWYYSGTGNAAVLSGSNIPTAPAVCAGFHGRLFLAEGRRLAWSNYMADWTTFSSDDEQYFNDTITGLRVFGNSANELTSVLMIFTKNGGIHACRFAADISDGAGGYGIFVFEDISGKHGCVASKSVQECVMNDGSLIVVWADHDGLKCCTPDMKVIKLTDNIQPTWDALNAAQLSNAFGLYYKPRNWYMFFCANGTSTTHDRVLIFDTRVFKCVSFFDWAVSAANIVRISGIEYVIGSDYSGYWNRYDYGQNDNTAAINAYFYTRAMDNGYPLQEKGFMSINFQHALLGEYTINFQAYYDDRSQYTDSVTYSSVGTALGAFVLDQDVLARDSTLAMGSKEIAGRGHNIQLRVSNATADQPFRIHRMQVAYRMGRTSHLISA